MKTKQLKYFIIGATIVIVTMFAATVMANKNIQFKIEFNTFTPDKVETE